MADCCPSCGFQLTPSTRRRAVRLPDDWEIPESWILWAMTQRPNLNHREQAAMFKDYWIAKAGKDGAKLNWEATWRNWIRGARSTGTSAPSPATRVSSTRSPTRMTDAQRAKSLGENLPRILEELGIKTK